MNKKLLLLLSSLSGLIALLYPARTLAHCPLCVGGAGAAASLAALVGVRYGAIGVFIGAFAVAMALWLPRFIKKQYIPHQRKILITVLYITTILPLIPLLQDYTSVYITLNNDYGSLLNRTYLINWFVVGIIIGTLIMIIAPVVSKQISKWRDGKIVRFQGLYITFGLLALAASILQVVK